MADYSKIRLHYRNTEEVTDTLNDEDILTYIDMDQHGAYKFFHYIQCGAPQIVHNIKSKCRRDVLNREIVLQFEEEIKQMTDFKTSLEKARTDKHDAECLKTATFISTIVKGIVTATKEVAAAAPTTQVVRPRIVPTWSGQRLERYREEVEKWTEDNKSTELTKYYDLVESLKQNKSEKVKQYVINVLLEKVKEDKTVKRVLELLEEKFKKTTCEKVRNVEKRWIEFGVDGEIEKVVGDWERIMDDMTKLGLMTEIRKYAMSARFIDKLEEAGKIDTTEKYRLRDMIQNNRGEPLLVGGLGNSLLNNMKKELESLRVIENRGEPFVTETKTYWTKTDDTRSRYAGWKKDLERRGYKRSTSHPAFFKNAANSYVREVDSRYARTGLRYDRDKSSSRFGRSKSRSDSVGSASGRRNMTPGKSAGNSSGKEEQNAKNIAEMQKQMKDIQEKVTLLITAGTHLVGEEIVYDIKLIGEDMGKKMIIDSGAPVSLMSREWFERYVIERRVNPEEIYKKKCWRRFRLGKTVYDSKETVSFPVILKTGTGDMMRKTITANLIEMDKAILLCGDETLRSWNTMLDFKEGALYFKDTEKKVYLVRKTHILANLEMVGIVGDDVAVMVVEDEGAMNLKNIREIHQNLNHKGRKQIENAYRNAGKWNTEIRKLINIVVDECKLCRMNKRSSSTPTVALPVAGDFNEILAIDLKVMGDKYILWMVCSFTKFAQGVVIKDKKAETIMNALHLEWCMRMGYPSRGFWCDNGGELEEFVGKLGIEVEFTPSYSPWSNGVNERNHYSCDVAVRKILASETKVSLDEAVKMAAWTHNTNVNIHGQSPLNLVTGKSVIYPGVTDGNMVTESAHDSIRVREIMERHYEIMKTYREAEYSRKLDKAANTRKKGYEDEPVRADDMVFYQHKDGKAWCGPVKVFSVKGNSIFLFANGSMCKVPRCRIQLWRGTGDNEEVADQEKQEEEEKVFEEGEARVQFEEDEDDKEKSKEEVERRVTRSMTEKERDDLRNDSMATFWFQVENNECYDEVAIYAVEIQKEDHKRKK